MGSKICQADQKRNQNMMQKNSSMLFLQELSAAYEEADSMRGLAQELNITLTVDY